MWVTSLGLAGEAGIFASLPFYPMFSGVPNGPLRLSPPQVHAAVHNSGYYCRKWTPSKMRSLIERNVIIWTYALSLKKPGT